MILKKIIRLVVLLPLIFLVGCFIDSGPWTELGGRMIYNIDITQNSGIIIVDVTVNTDELALLREDVFTDGGYYSEPEELFVWMSPIFADRDDRIFYPVARERLNYTTIDENTHFSISFDLKKIARNNAFWFLESWHLDHDEWDNLNGMYVFLSDGFSQYWDYQQVLIDYDYFSFDRSRPSGTGNSNLRLFPGDDENWIPVLMESEGISFSQTQVLGNSAFQIILQMSETISGPIIIDDGSGNTFDLDVSTINTEASNPEDFRYVWDVTFTNNPGDEDLSQNIIYVDPNVHYFFPYSWIWVRYESDYWYENNFEFRGMANTIVEEDFTGRSIAEFTTYAENGAAEENNWNIQEITVSEYLPVGTASAHLLGIGSGGEILLDYEPNRNDSVVIWDANIQNLMNNYSTNEIFVALSYKYSFDWNWSDRVIIEIERNGWWDWIGSIEGVPDNWMLQNNNGWQFQTWSIWDWNIDYSLSSQKLRFRFESNEYNEGLGVLIDDFMIYTLEY